MNYEVVFEHNFGQETYGEIILKENGKYQVYVTPQYGGYFESIGKEYNTLEDAKVFLFAEFT